mmetsp:Transcript_9301/g.29509  ORF Transcript_9301/g.29509 Transcript_9301/m.29509 type:complete len:153 (+) Transcript_9301:31-489(+)
MLPLTVALTLSGLLFDTVSSDSNAPSDKAAQPIRTNLDGGSLALGLAMTVPAIGVSAGNAVVDKDLVEVREATVTASVGAKTDDAVGVPDVEAEEAASVMVSGVRNALRSLFGDSLAPGVRAGWPASLGNGRVADTHEEREWCRKWRRAALC